MKKIDWTYDWEEEDPDKMKLVECIKSTIFTSFIGGFRSDFNFTKGKKYSYDDSFIHEKSGYKCISLTSDEGLKINGLFEHQMLKYFEKM